MTTKLQAAITELIGPCSRAVNAVAYVLGVFTARDMGEIADVYSHWGNLRS